MKRRSFVPFALVLSSLLTACNHQDTTPSSTVTTSYAVTGSGQIAVALSPIDRMFSFIVPRAYALTPPPLVDASGLPVDLNDAWIVLKKVQFKTSEDETSDGNEDSYHFKGPFYVDLLSDDPVSFGEVQLPTTGLRRVKMLLHKASPAEVPAGAPAALSGKSIYLAGQVNGHALTFAADDTADFTVKGPRAVVPEHQKDLLTVIRIADIFERIDLSSISADTAITASNRVSAMNPCPTIHATASDLYTCFKTGIALEARFGKDDGDHDLDSHDETVD
jgi:hypothetical protein